MVGCHLYGVGGWVTKNEGYARREAFGIDDGAAVDILRALVLFNHRNDGRERNVFSY